MILLLFIPNQPAFIVACFCGLSSRIHECKECLFKWLCMVGAMQQVVNWLKASGGLSLMSGKFVAFTAQKVYGKAYMAVLCKAVTHLPPPHPPSPYVCMYTYV